MDGGLDLAMVVVDAVLLPCLLLLVVLEHHASESHCFVDVFFFESIFKYARHLAIYLRYGIALPCFILKCTQVVVESNIG